MKKKVIKHKKINSKVKQLIKNNVKLKESLKKERINNIKKLFKKNRLYCLYTIKTLYPYVLMIFLTISSIKLCGGGFPIKKDNIIGRKVYDLNINNNITQMESKYESRASYFLLGTELEHSDYLTITTPWIYYNNKYTRQIKKYEISNIEELYNLLLNEEYDKIDSILNLADVKKESTNVEQVINDKYIVTAKLNFLDKEDKIYIRETDLKNIIITILELLIIGLSGYLINRQRTYDIDDYISDIKTIKRNIKLVSLKETKNQIKENKKNILLLTNRGKRYGK